MSEGEKRRKRVREKGRHRHCPPLILSPLLLLFSLSTAAAQVSDTLSVADVVVMTDSTVAADTTASAPSPASGPPVPLTTPDGPLRGVPITAVPVYTAALDPADLLGRAPGFFRYALGAPGWPDGLSLDGLGPTDHALALDGIPYTDLFTGRPREDLLPLETLDRFRKAPTLWGRPGALVATVRPYRFDAPVTELRYLPGQEGLQYVSVTHAQTRKPPRLVSDSEQRGRVTYLGHVAGRQSTGLIAGEALGGWHAFARMTLTRPRFAAELTELHVRHAHGARAGVAIPAAGPLTVLDPQAERQSEWNLLALTVRTRLSGEHSVGLSLWWARQHERYSQTRVDTLWAKGNQYGGRLRLALPIGGYEPDVHLSGWLDGKPWGQSNPYASADAQLSFHAHVQDSLRLGGWVLEPQSGVHYTNGHFAPTGSLRISRGRAFGALRYSATTPGRIAESGFTDVITGLESQRGSSVQSAEAGAAFHLGAFDLRVQAQAAETRRPLLLVQRGSAFQYAQLGQSLRHAQGVLSLTWRDRRPRGVYARSQLTAYHALDVARAENDEAQSLAQREGKALPALHGHAHGGFRALDLFEGALDLDLGVRVAAWTAFQGRAFVPVAALFALPDPAVTPEVPARGTVDLLMEARLREQARVFLAYENMLATRLYSEAYRVPLYPLPAHRLRFGVFWTLFN